MEEALLHLFSAEVNQPDQMGVPCQSIAADVPCATLGATRSGQEEIRALRGTACNFSPEYLVTEKRFFMAIEQLMRRKDGVRGTDY